MATNDRERKLIGGIKLSDGKKKLTEAKVYEYTVTQTTQGRLIALRYGNEWKDYTGDNCMLMMLTEIVRLKELIDEQERFMGMLAEDQSMKLPQELERGGILKWLEGYEKLVAGSVPIVSSAIREVVDYIKQRGDYVNQSLEQAKDERLTYECALNQIAQTTLDEKARLVAHLALGDKVRKHNEKLERVINPKDRRQQAEEDEKYQQDEEALEQATQEPEIHDSPEHESNLNLDDN